jgi:dsDNA-binding SOS-regulon protein
MKNYKITFEDKKRNDLFDKVKSFSNKKEASSYAKIYIANSCDDSTFFRIVKL